ncbi:amino acid adenylation domain-containing protein [Streptomyces sp. NBC_01537]|uniref:non-ribosomal peptide synthetase n=1 Tax=Streptomyces sp. NBC_01537 TaxID=2903896 RepID=UPI00386572FE
MSAGTVDAFAISPQQELTWRKAESRGGRAVPVTVVVELRGPLDLDRLYGAARRVIEHHEILRTELRILDGYVAPAQVIRPHPEQVPGAEADAASAGAASAGAAEDWYPEAVVESTPVSLAVRRVGPNRHVLRLRASAAVLDRAGAAVLIDELARAYAGAGAGAGEDPLQYADLAEWLRERVGDGRFEHPRYLREVDDDTTALRLPFELPVRCGDGSTAAAAIELADVLPPDSADRLAAVGGDLRDLLLAAWQVVLHRYTGADRLLTGLVDGGRSAPELAGALGPLARLLPLQVAVAADTPFRDLVRRCHAAFEHAEGESELFDAAWWSTRDTLDVIAFDHVDLGAPRAAGDLLFAPVAVHGVHPGAGLALLVDQVGACAARVALGYDPARFTEADLAGLGTVLRTVLAHAVADPDTHVGALRVWPDGADQPDRAVAEMPAGGAVRLVPARFAEQRMRNPDATAVEDSATTLSYGQLDRFADRLAARLAAAGAGPGSVVPVLLERGAPTIGAMLGIWRAGAAFTVLDDTTPPGRIAATLADTGTGVVVTSAALAGRLAESAIPCLLIEDLPDEEAPAAVRSDPDPAALAYVVYTSGSTGRPKGVAVSHGALATYVHEVGQRLPGAAGSSFAVITTVAADLGYTAVFSALASGGRLSVVPRSAATDPAELSAWMSDREIDCLKIVPSHLAALLNAAEDPARVLPRRLLVVGGEACPIDLVERVAAIAPECVVVNHYGPTETTVGVCTFPAGASPLDPRARTVPIGTPLPGTRAAVWDGTGRPVPAWMPGELYLSGAQLADGYLKQPERTAERFLSAPAAPGGAPVRWYRTGDVVRALPGGELEYLGRTDDQLKINGYRVEPQEIEAVLRGHPGMRECLVTVAGPDRVLTAFVALEASGPTVEELSGHLRTVLPEHMVPKAFAVVAALPRTANGKVDRAQLLAMDSTAGRAAAAVPPRDSLELRILEIWRAMLGSDRFGVTDDFFAVGGHSLLALQLLAAVSRKLGARLPISVLFENGTVEGLARAVRAQAEWQSTVLVPMRPDGTRPPVYCVHAGGGSVMGYLDLVRAMPADVPVYGLEAVGLDGRRAPVPHVREMVEQYAAEIGRRTEADAVPSTIVGWGLGAVFAYALAERLRGLGHRIGTLVVIDGAAPDTRALRAVVEGTSDDDYYAGMTNRQIVERFAAHYGLPLTAADLAGRSVAEQQALLAAAMRDRDVLTPDAGAEHFETLFALYRSNIAACQEYVLGFRPEFGDYDVLLVRTDEESAVVGPDGALGWRTLFGDRVTQVWLPGDHYSVMKPPIVGRLVPFIDKALSGLA